MGVISLLTVQNSHGVRRVSLVEPQLLAEQIDALFEEAMPTALKTGALGGAEQVEVVADRLRGRALPLVVDPVLLSKNGGELLDADGCSALRRQILPLARLLTPNLPEAERLLGRVIRDPEGLPDAARALAQLGPQAVLLKGGHRRGDPIDLLFEDGQLHELRSARVDTPHTHGVGCALSAAIAARLALGCELLDACRLAKHWLTRAIETAPGIGAGHGPVNHFAPLPAESD